MTTTRRKYSVRYIKAANNLRERILSADQPPGSKLPSESQLCASFGVSRITVRQALRQVIDEGLVLAWPGKGYFVAESGASRTEATATAVAEAPEPTRQDPAPAAAATLTHPTRTALLGGRTAVKQLVLGVTADYPLLRTAYAEVFDGLRRRYPELTFTVRAIPTSEDLFAHAAGCDIFQTPGRYLPWFVKRGLLFDPGQGGDLSLSSDAFFDAFVEGATCGGRVWGVPMIACGNTTYARFDASAPGDGFWARLESLAGRTPPAGREAWIASDHSVFDLLSLADARTAAIDDLDARYAHPAFAAFLARLEPLVRQPGLFHPLGAAAKETLGAYTLFPEGRTDYAFGCTSWIADNLPGCGFAWTAWPMGCEDGGKIPVEANVNVISDQTRYPEECVTVLRYLAEAHAQTVFARQGQCVAHREGIPALARVRPELSRVAATTFARARLPRQSADDAGLAYTMTVVNHEVGRWQRGEMGWEELQETLRRKTRLFFRHERAAGS